MKEMTSKSKKRRNLRKYDEFESDEKNDDVKSDESRFFVAFDVVFSKAFKKRRRKR